MNLNLNGLEPKEENVELKKINDDLEWDSKVQQSSQYSIYLTSNFLRWSDLLKYRYFLYENSAPILGCVLPPKIVDGLNSLSYCMYQGIFFIENPKGRITQNLYLAQPFWFKNEYEYVFILLDDCKLDYNHFDLSL
jgi:hypothetical protein